MINGRARIRCVAFVLLLLASLSVHAVEPLIVAHRGASRDAPENTIRAFELAWKQGADAIEGDFHQTKDGYIVCIHDKTTRNVSDRNLVVRKSSLEALRQLDVGSHHSVGYKGVVIPTIAEVFATIPQGKKIYVEIKSSASIIPRLLEEIEKSGLENEQVVVISFHEKVIRSLKSKAPQYKALWLSGFRERKSGRINPSMKTILKTLSRIKADGFSSAKDAIDEALIKSIMEKGYEYHVWTVDELETAKRFRKWGAKSITTNVPGYMRKNLFEAYAASALEAMPDKLVVLTFDDSVKSHYTVARPILQQYGFGATFFITEGFSFPNNKVDYMTWDEIAALDRAGFEIGNHTRDHMGVNSKTIARLKAQLEAIDARCEEHGIAKPISFAWPGNGIDLDALVILRDHGMHWARRGGFPEYPRGGERGFPYEPGLDHPLLIPSAGIPRPGYTFEEFVETLQGARDGKAVVLQFHGVPEGEHPWVHISRATFERFMAYLSEHDFQVIALRDLARYANPNVEPKDPMAIVEARKAKMGLGVDSK